MSSVYLRNHTLKIVYAFLTATFFVMPSSVLARAGNSDGGGGQALVFEDGTVRFLDLLPLNEIPKKTMSSARIQETFFKPRYVKQIAQKLPNFFQCATEKLAPFVDSEKAIERLLPQIQKARASLISFRLKNSLDEMLQTLPVVGTASESVDANLQEPLAVFANREVWITKLYPHMSREDQCGLSVHETLRLLNYNGIIEEPLTTAEIEVATRFFMGKSREREDVRTVFEKLAKTTKTRDELRKLADEKLQMSKTISQDLSNRWNQLSAEERGEMEAKSWGLLNESSNLVTGSVQTTINDILPQIRIGILGSAILERMYDSLEGKTYFDTYTLNLVER